MRLTKKSDNLYYTNAKFSSGSVFLDNNGNYTNACVDKLGQLEDIEEELGIDLVTLFKALKGIYIKPNNIYVGSPYLCFAENENRELEFQFKVVDTWYKVKDYGKTWALTKEELL